MPRSEPRRVHILLTLPLYIGVRLPQSRHPETDNMPEYFDPDVLAADVELTRSERVQTLGGQTIRLLFASGSASFYPDADRKLVQLRDG